jgi:hypothetical protein
VHLALPQSWSSSSICRSIEAPAWAWHVAQWAGYWALAVYLNNVLPNEVRAQ